MEHSFGIKVKLRDKQKISVGDVRKLCQLALDKDDGEKRSLNESDGEKHSSKISSKDFKRFVYITVIALLKNMFMKIHKQY